MKIGAGGTDVPVLAVVELVTPCLHHTWAIMGFLGALSEASLWPPQASSRVLAVDEIVANHSDIPDRSHKGHCFTGELVQRNRHCLPFCC